jgi:hypothetical protein
MGDAYTHTVCMITTQVIFHGKVYFLGGQVLGMLLVATDLAKNRFVV